MTLFEDFIIKTTEQGRQYAEEIHSGKIVAVECKDCGSMKSVDQFSKGNSRGLNFYPYCKECAKRRRDDYLDKRALEVSETAETSNAELTAQQCRILKSFKDKHRDCTYVAKFTSDILAVLGYMIKNQGDL